MKYAILALGLFATPAAAETYGLGKCEFIRHMLDNCAVHSSELIGAGLAARCDPTTTGGMRKAMSHLINNDPKFDYFKFTTHASGFVTARSPRVTR